MDTKIEKETEKMNLSEKNKNKKEKKKKDQCVSLFPVELNPAPEYISWREEMYQKLKKESDDWLANQKPEPIKIKLPDGKEIEGLSWKTTPYEVAKGISQGLADNSVVAKVNGEVWDLDRPFEGNSSLELLKFDHPDAKAVFWHSSAHILGEAMEKHYGGHLCYGPPIDEGFYYDMFLQDRSVNPDDYNNLEKLINKIQKEKQPFERLVMKKKDLINMFKHNEFKQRILNEKVKTETTTIYKCGDLIDLCRGPHVRNTGSVKSIKITKHSSSYWEGDSGKESLQRIYGISFPSTNQMREWIQIQEEALKRDHRKIGRDQELFFFHELSPGSCFFLPKGAYIYNTLIQYIQDEYRKRGFTEVVTPNIYNVKLWETSGHWNHYKENMFSFESEGEKFALKPMNCPGHCLMFNNRPRSWKELPIRFSDFGVLHRNELSGALSGLTRVRRFQQDDAHIFCRNDQLKAEIEGCLDFLKSVYSIFGFTFQLKLSTRPSNFLGEIEAWNEAEKQLKESLDNFGEKWELNPGDGAFYGPKIDITIMDALRRPHQCATIQLDFQLPIRFNLYYVTSDEKSPKERPVIIHRAILGSVERMIAILCENFAGKWPFWLSPRQVMIIPVAPPFDNYANKIKEILLNDNIKAEVDLDCGDTMNKKIRNAQLNQFNFIIVVGEKEEKNNTVNIRTRDNKIHGEVTIETIINKFKNMLSNKYLNCEERFDEI